MARLSQSGDGAWVRIARRGFRDTCCDCGLTHTMTFRVRAGQLEMRAVRNERSTSQNRRQGNYQCKPKRKR